MNVLIADDHPLTLFGTANFVLSLGYKVSDMCNNGITALNLIQSHVPDVALLDVNMPGMDGIEICEKVSRLKSKTRVVLLTMHNERSMFTRSVECGAYGYLLKNFSAEELGACLKAVANHQKYVSSHIESELVHSIAEAKSDVLNGLTLTERKVIELISKQKNSRQIAELLFSSEKTIEGHRRNIIEKLKLPKEKNQLLIWALEHKDLFA